MQPIFAFGVPTGIPDQEALIAPAPLGSRNLTKKSPSLAPTLRYYCARPGGSAHRVSYIHRYTSGFRRSMSSDGIQPDSTPELKHYELTLTDGTLRVVQAHRVRVLQGKLRFETDGQEPLVIPASSIVCWEASP